MTPRRPPALRPGDLVAVVAPAAAVDGKSLDRGVRALARLGYRVHVTPEAGLRSGYLAGSDRARARSLRRALSDPRVRAVFLARAGYGTARVLPFVERDLARARPKIVLGYSDATALLDFLTCARGWITFHGPMVANDFASLAAGDLRALRATLGGERRPSFPVRSVLRPGRAEGRLFGGNLATIASLLGTPYGLDSPRLRLRGGILFLEDRNEKPYRIDRMLTQLRLTGLFDHLKAIVFGEMTDCGGARELRRVIRDVTSGYRFPVAMGLPSGHGRGKRTVPLGVRARIDTARRVVEILGAVVAAG